MNRWIMDMRKYHYEIKYVQGKYNYVADQLSRPVKIVQRCPTTTILVSLQKNSYNARKKK